MVNLWNAHGWHSTGFPHIRRHGEIHALDEMYSQGDPVLAGVDLDGGYIFGKRQANPVGRRA